MQLLRWLAALFGVPALLFLCWLGVVPFAITLTILAGVALSEILKAQRASGMRPSVLIAVLGLLGPAVPLIFPDGLRASPLSLSALAGSIMVLILAAFILEVVVAERTHVIHVGAHIGQGLLAAIYVALFGSLSVLRMPQSFEAVLPWPSMDPSFLLVVVVLSSVWATDTAAYYVGCNLGTRKLAPGLSPHKTVEGAVAGLACGVLVGCLLGHFLLGRALLGWWIGATSGVIGQLGDLFESALKRELGIKDFGSIIPGHGGVLDRFDSVLFTAPVVWLLIQIIG